MVEEGGGVGNWRQNRGGEKSIPLLDKSEVGLMNANNKIENHVLN